MMLDEYGELLTIDDLCELLMIGKTMAYQIFRSGQVKAFRLGRCWKIPKKSVQALIEQAAES